MRRFPSGRQAVFGEVALRVGRRIGNGYGYGYGARDVDDDRSQTDAGEPRPPASRARCPTCGARRAPGRAECHRCRTDLSILLEIERRSDAAFAGAIDAYRAGRFRTAISRAEAAQRLEARPECLRLIASAAARAGDFVTALRTARRILASPPR